MRTFTLEQLENLIDNAAHETAELLFLEAMTAEDDEKTVYVMHTARACERVAAAIYSKITDIYEEEKDKEAA